MVKELRSDETSSRRIMRDIHDILNDAFSYALEDDLLKMRNKVKTIQRIKRTDYGEVIETIPIGCCYSPLIKDYDNQGIYDKISNIRERIKKGGLIEVTI
jgi:hypothetical protein